VYERCAEMETEMVLMGVSGPFEEWEVSANAITKESIDYKCWITLINQLKKI